MLKTVGIVGGIGPESTIDYYRQIIAAYQEHSLDGNYPRIIINSINLKRMVDLVTQNNLAAVTENLLRHWTRWPRRKLISPSSQQTRRTSYLTTCANVRRCS